MSRIPFVSDEIDMLVEAAKRMFSAISDVSAELTMGSAEPESLGQETTATDR